MHKALFGILFLFMVSVSLISCTSSPDKMIVGTWSLLGPDMKKSEELKLHFKENHIAVAMSPGREPSSRDSVKYEISKDGKKLTTTMNNGRTEVMQILELSEKKLTLAATEGKDTIHLVKE